MSALRIIHPLVQPIPLSTDERGRWFDELAAAVSDADLRGREVAKLVTIAQAVHDVVPAEWTLSKEQR